MKSTWTPEREAMARKLKAQGLTAPAAAKQLNATVFKNAKRAITRNAVIAFWHRCGLGKKSNPGGALSMTRKEITQAKKTGAPTLKYVNVRKEGPEKGKHSVRYSEREDRTCVMFCAGESGVDGFVCGAPVVALTAWCEACARIVYMPAPGRAA